MPRLIVKLHDKQTNQDFYMEWSTIVDAPVTYGMPLDAFINYYRDEYGKSGINDLPTRLERVKKNGISSYIGTLSSLLSINQAGENGKHLSIEEILDNYCRNWGKANKT